MPDSRSTRQSVRLRRWEKLASDLVESLPTRTEKELILGSLDEVLSFFSELRGRLAHMPTIEDSGELSERLVRLNTLFAELERSPILGRSIMANRPRTKADRRGGALGTPEELLEELRNTDEKDRTTVLQKLTGEQLRSVASRLGIGSGKRLSREVLERQVEMKIANTKGYELLRGGGVQDNPGPNIRS